MTSEAILEPELPICDAHHHLWLDTGHTGFPYTVDDLRADTSSGHNVQRTVFVECHAEYRQDGPVELRPVGEVEFVAEAAETSARTPGPEIEGIVGHADLTLGDAVQDVLAALEVAGRGRFRGVRHTTAWDPAPMGNNAVRGGSAGRERVPRRRAHARRARRLVRRDGVPHADRRAHRPGAGLPRGDDRGQPPLRADRRRAVPGPGRRGAGGVAPGSARAGPVRQRGAEDRGADPAAVRRALGQAGGQGVVARRSPRRGATRSRFAIDAFGPSRCMFESNFPVDKACFGYVEVWNAFKRMAAPFSSGGEARPLPRHRGTGVPTHPARPVIALPMHRLAGASA